MDLSSVPPTRRQLTLWVEGVAAGPLEALRQRLDPVQAALISAHVTLCREDEIHPLSLEQIAERVAAWPDGPLTLGFGAPQRFNGHGVLLPCEQGKASFQALRAWVLRDAAARRAEAHLTLAHPRNPKASGNTDLAWGDAPTNLVLRFGTVALIEQRGCEPWVCLATHRLGDGPRAPS